MGAQRLCSRGLGDEDTGKMAQQFSTWTQSLLDSMKHRSAVSDHSAPADTLDSSDGYARQTHVLMTGTSYVAYQALVCWYNAPSLIDAGPSRTGTLINRTLLKIMCDLCTVLPNGMDICQHRLQVKVLN